MIIYVTNMNVELSKSSAVTVPNEDNKGHNGSFIELFYKDFIIIFYIFIPITVIIFY